MDRLNKYLAHAGLGSRRHCEELIVAGRVSIDGRTVKDLATRVTPEQKVKVDGESIQSSLEFFASPPDEPRGWGRQFDGLVGGDQPGRLVSH